MFVCQGSSLYHQCLEECPTQSGCSISNLSVSEARTHVCIHRLSGVEERMAGEQMVGQMYSGMDGRMHGK